MICFCFNARWMSECCSSTPVSRIAIRTRLSSPLRFTRIAGCTTFCKVWNQESAHPDLHTSQRYAKEIYFWSSIAWMLESKWALSRPIAHCQEASIIHNEKRRCGRGMSSVAMLLKVFGQSTFNWTLTSRCRNLIYLFN
jgi:hypothetical protein